MDELFTAVYTAGVVSLLFTSQWELGLILSPILIMWLAFSLGLWNDDNEKTTNANDRQDAR